ncbi:helix-turn-helix domain-containing protein [Microbacterium sp. NPDC089987]|uniref:helix-turn-helix domain-containing protein n=1 Tax=Microbacterium sp. NPDC089987 TaxID=3364202 RepID=UPI003821BE21
MIDTAKAGTLIRLAREDAGMSQRALAQASGVQQSNIAAAESGRRSVSNEMLDRLLDAADYRPSVPLALKREEIRRIGDQLGVRGIRVFGSVSRGADHRGSDIDLLVDLDATAAGFELGAFVAAVRDLTGFDADVIVDRGDRPEMAHIRATAVPL